MFCSLDGKTKAYCTPALYNGVPGRFYHNNGDGTFTDFTERAGFLPAPGKTLGAAETDFNRDGWPDILVANDTERNLLYENNGDGTFTEKGLISGIAFDEVGKARAGMGVDAGVVDSTGEISIFVGNFSNEMIGVFRHTGRGYFTDRAALSKIGRPSLLILTFGVQLFDVDFDTDLDLLAANGHIQKLIQDGSTYRQASQIYLNQGNGTFQLSNQDIGRPFQEKLVARSASLADFDRDGDQDILVTENGGPAHLWRNENHTGHFLRVRLQGRSSNRDGVDSRIAGYLGKFMMERRVRTGGSYLSNSEKPVTFGLGDATALDSLIIHWPGGTVDRFTRVKANQMIRITEGSGEYQQEVLTGYSPPPDLATQ
ncbi:MAG: CRTAC1 family protein [Calditrichota bacterium]